MQITRTTIPASPKVFSSLFSGLLAFAAFTLAGQTWLATPGFAQQPVGIIQMTDELRYVPESIAIRAGDTVEWRNVGTIGHTVTTDPAKAEVRTHAIVPARAETFDSGTIPGGGSFTHTFEVPGRYVYFCIPHEMLGMIGEIIVE